MAQTAQVATRLAAVVVAGLFLGTLSAWLAIGWSALFLCLLPCWALLFGLALARRSAMVATGALLIGNSLWATWPLPDPAALVGVAIKVIVTGGVLLFVVTAAVNMVRTRRSIVRFSIAAVVFSAFFGWSAFLAVPRWNNTYQVTVKTDAPLERVVLVLPMPMLKGEQFLELLNRAHYARPSGPHVVRTSANEFGEMVEFDMALVAEYPRAAPKQTGYRGNVIFRDQGIGWRPYLELGQRQHVGFVLPHPFSIYGGPFKREKGRITTRYDVPVRAWYGRDVEVDMNLRVATEKWSFVSYSQEKWWSRTDEVVASDFPQDTWVEFEVMGRERIWLSRIGE